ncbi:uncharacterized protein LOC112568318 [Pomacea canaliculata]|uniref:uncharacterized protein LOC112568318 n=1 Tax=Pomacea canaliculata TaxID=400727 RepID=UPI000D7345B0|nr:uncharacterized protein LOC112568318 [Pomacea canaliculata]
MAEQYSCTTGLRSTKAGRTRMDSTPDGNELVSARPTHRRRRAQGVSTAHHRLPPWCRCIGILKASLHNNNRWTLMLSLQRPHLRKSQQPCPADRWTWGQRLSRAVRRFLPLTATDPREVSSHISELDEWDIYSDSSVDAVYANCTDLIQSSNIK